jgi:3-methyladenine DNA glycosylase/8-oxoguanine DNA glycosylase
MNITLPARPPFNFTSVVRSHGWFQLAPFREDPEAGALYCAVRLPSGRVADLRLCAVLGGVSVQLADDLSEAEQTQIAETVNWMLDLDQDFSLFYALAAQEPRLANAAAQARGRILRSPTLFEDIVKTILTTNTAWGGTKGMVRALVENFGDPLERPEPVEAPPPPAPVLCAFPTPERLAALDEATLRAKGRLGYRAPYVLELARRVAEGQVVLEQFKDRSLPTPDLRKRLLALKGVGDYAAANLLMLLGRYDYIPVDSWALKMVSQEWYGGAPVERAQVEAAFARWGEWKGLAYWLWEWESES